MRGRTSDGMYLEYNDFTQVIFIMTNPTHLKKLIYLQINEKLSKVIFRVDEY